MYISVSLSLYIYIYTHISLYTYIYIYIHNIRTYYVYIHMNVSIHIYIYIYIVLRRRRDRNPQHVASSPVFHSLRVAVYLNIEARSPQHVTNYVLFHSCVWLFTLLDSRVSSLHRGHANLLQIVPMSTDDPRRESIGLTNFEREKRAYHSALGVLSLPPFRLRLEIPDWTSGNQLPPILMHRTSSPEYELFLQF